MDFITIGILLLQIQLTLLSGDVGEVDDDYHGVTDCGLPDLLEEEIVETPKIPIATNGEEFPWDDVR